MAQQRPGTAGLVQLVAAREGHTELSLGSPVDPELSFPIPHNSVLRCACSAARGTQAGRNGSEKTHSKWPQLCACPEGGQQQRHVQKRHFKD